MQVDGEECLFYKPSRSTVGIIRATTADADGNLTMEREALTLESLAIAMAAHNCGGIVIAQVERIAERGTLHAAPGEDARACWSTAWWWPKPEHHWQTFADPLQPRLFAARCACRSTRSRRCRWTSAR